jgi:phosphoenolpyruvate carboxylase
VAANWLLWQAQASLAEVADRVGIELTLFHGRGGTVGRGGGRLDRAILGQPPGTVRGRLKVTEQGEVVAARYGHPQIALRHLELLAGAVIAADARRRRPCPHPTRPSWGGSPRRRRQPTGARLRRSRLCRLLRADHPIDVLTELRLGSAGVARGAGRGGPPVDIERLRAIPWGFAWAQARIELPGWFGLGAAVDALPRADRARLARLYELWPFLTAVIDHAELALARSDLDVGRRYARLAAAPGDAARWAAIEAEHGRSVRAVLEITGRSRLLERSLAIARQIELRNPDVDTLSELQVGRLARMRALPADDTARVDLERLVRLTVSGVAAGLQVTG